MDRNDKAIPIKIDDSGSPSSRRAWIEIYGRIVNADADSVALLAEGVDRNDAGEATELGTVESPSSRRAWIEIMDIKKLAELLGSPSSRRAWIEITMAYTKPGTAICRPPRGGRG